MPKEDVRRIRLPMIVDTGANMLVLPEEVVDKLGLRILDYTPVEYADGRIEQRPIAGPVGVIVAGRDAEVRCIVGPRGTEPLLGQLVLEITGLLVDCLGQRLVGNPRSPDRPLYKVY